MFSKADNYMTEGCFQSVSSCGKNPYIGDLYLHFFLYCFIFYEILRLPFWLKSFLMLHFLTFHEELENCSFTLFCQETDLLKKVIMKCVNIKLWDLLYRFHYILNAPRTVYVQNNLPTEFSKGTIFIILRKLC